MDAGNGTNLPDQQSPVRHFFSERFAIDLRSLTAFRIGLGVMLLADLWYRVTHLIAHYTDSGVLPRTVIKLSELAEKFHDPSFVWYWSLHKISGEPWFELTLFITAAVFAVCLLIGYRTRTAALASWVLLYSLHQRNFAINGASDGMLRAILFWSLFLPLGSMLSVDRWFRRPAQMILKRVFSVGSSALLLQVCFVYFFTALHKYSSVWWPGPAGARTTEFSAIYYALSLDSHVSVFGHWLLRFPTLLRLLTATTFLLELIGPLLVFSPIILRWLRIPLVFIFMGFHLGMFATMELGTFPFVAIVAWLPFIPSDFWDWCGRCSNRMSFVADSSVRRKVRRRLVSFRRLWVQHRRRTLWSSSPAILRHSVGSALSVIAAILLLYVFAWNVREVATDWTRREIVNFEDWLPRMLPYRLNGIGRVAGLDQRWAMYAPGPPVDDGWYVMRGVLRDGTEVNLWCPDTPLSYDKPRNVSATYVDQRWRLFLWNFRNDHRNQAYHSQYRKYFVEWLIRRWNQYHSNGRPERRVQHVEIIFRLERTPKPGDPYLEPKSVMLICGDVG